MLAEVARFNKFLRRKRPHTSTEYHYTKDLELFFDWISKLPTEITVRDIDGYVEHCQHLGHAISTIRRRLAAIRTFYFFLELDCDDPPPNPVIPRRHSIRNGRCLPRDAEDTDIERLFSIIESSCDRSIYLLMLRCGLRVGEVHRLSMGDLYLHPTPGSLPRLWIHGKSGSQRVVYLSAQALSALEEWLAVRLCVQDQAVFLSGWGQRLAIRTIQHRLAQYCRLAGVRITCHQLRHTFGRHMVEAGMPVTSIQRLMGHARIRTTQLYLRISDSQVQADYEAAIVQVSQRLSSRGGVR